MDPAINAASRENGLTYNRLIQGLGLAGIEVDRRILADLAVNEPATFAALVETAQKALPADTSAPKAALVSAARQRAIGPVPSADGARPAAPASTTGRVTDLLENPRSPDVSSAVAKLAKKAARAETGCSCSRARRPSPSPGVPAPSSLVDLYGRPRPLERYAARRRAASTSSRVRHRAGARRMADTVTPQGFVAVCQQFPTSVQGHLRRRGPSLVAILEEVREPGNAGTIIRAADCRRRRRGVLTGRSVDLYNPKVVRSTTGSLFHLPVAVGVELEDASTARMPPASRCSRPT